MPAAQTDEPETQRQTSAKFYELAKIIGGLGRSERVLVVSPLKSMLDDVHGGAAEHVEDMAGRRLQGIAQRS